MIQKGKPGCTGSQNTIKSNSLLSKLGQLAKTSIRCGDYHLLPKIRVSAHRQPLVNTNKDERGVDVREDTYMAILKWKSVPSI